MTGPFVLTALEEHLIQHHGVDVALISQTRDLYHDSDDMAEKSHDVMHALGFSNHVHEEVS